MILLFLLVLSTDALRIHNVLNIVKAVKEHYRSGCVYLVHGQDYGSTDKVILFNYKKLFTQSEVSFSTLSTMMVLRYPQVQECRRNRPLYLLINGQDHSRQVLTELSKNVRKSEITWLLFMNKKSDLEEFFTEVNIPFNCEFLVAQPQDDDSGILTEVYHLGTSLPLQTQSLGNWNASGVVISPTESSGLRRDNLTGLVLKTAIIHAGYMKILEEVSNKPLKVGGYFGDVWNTLEDHLHFTSDYYKPQDTAGGVLLPNGSWNGLVGMVVTGQTEVASSACMYTLQRMLAVDYFPPLITAKDMIYVRIPETTEVLWKAFLMPLSRGTWIAMTVLIMIISTSLFMAQRLWMHAGDKDQCDVSELGLFDIVLSLLSVFCSQGVKEPLSLLSTRIIHLTAYVTSVVIAVSYSASLMSYIMLQVYEPPFHNFEEFLKNDKYQLGVLANSAHITAFKMSNNSILRGIYDKHIEPYESTLPQSFEEVLHRLCKVRNYASMNQENPTSMGLRMPNCSILRIPKAYIESSATMVIRKGSPYKRIFTFALHNMLRSGLLQILRKRNVPDAVTMQEMQFKSVTLNHVVPIFAVLAAGVVLATLFVVFEFATHAFLSK